MVFPYFLQLTAKRLALTDLISVGPLVILFLVFVAINLLCAMYPALLFSSFAPAQVLKGKLVGDQKLQLQKVMLTMQFVISAGMIVCTLVILKQVNYIRTRDAGMAIDRVIKVPLPLNEKARKLAVPFRNTLSRQSGVLKASLVGTNAVPGGELDLSLIHI